MEEQNDFYRVDSKENLIRSTSSLKIILESKEEEENPKSSNLQSLMNLIKGNVGTGIFTLPIAFKYGGIWISLISVILIGTISIHCMHLLLSSAFYIKKKTNKNYLNYGDVVENIFNIMPLYLSKHSTKISNATNVFLAATQFGFCVAYIVFMASNLEKVVEEYHNINWPIQFYEFFLLILLLPYNCIKQLKILSFFSLLANIFTFFGLSVIFYNCFQNVPPISSKPFFGSWSSFPLFSSIVLFSFEAIGLILPIFNNMKKPENLRGWGGLINIGMSFCILLYAAFGFFGYLKYGEEIKSSITLNLPHSIFYSIVRLSFVISIFFSYGIQFYVPIDFIWRSISQIPRVKNSSFFLFGEYILRVTLVCFTYVLAAVVPHLDLVVSLLGAFSGSIVALILPSILDLLLLTYHFPKTFSNKIKIIKNILIVAFGIFALVFGSFVSIFEIYKALKNKKVFI